RDCCYCLEAVCIERLTNGLYFFYTMLREEVGEFTINKIHSFQHGGFIFSRIENNQGAFEIIYQRDDIHKYPFTSILNEVAFFFQCTFAKVIEFSVQAKVAII